MYNIARFIFIIYLNVFNKTKIIGKENLPQTGGAVVFANHVSAFDIFLLAIASRRHLHFMAKKSLFKIPVVNWFIKAFKAFPVERNTADMTAMKTAVNILEKGDLLGIFPEGTRKFKNKTGAVHGGAVMFAHKAKVPLIPVKLIYKNKRKIFTSFYIIIGEPINWQDLGIIQETSSEYKKSIIKLMEKLYEL